MDWWKSLENVNRLLEYLVEKDEAELSWSWIHYYIAKPWKWNDEWSAFLKANPRWRT